MQAWQHLRFERVTETGGDVGVITLDRPDRLNALNPLLMEELALLFEQLRGESADLRVILLRGEGRAFCAGADIKADTFTPPGPGAVQRQMELQQRCARIVRAMRNCPQPIIALVQGPACGGGFSLALAADVRILTPDARMNAAYLQVGLGGADMGSGYLLTRLVGHSVASALLLTGDFIGAERAREVGLAAEIAEPDQLYEAGLAFARRMLRNAPLALRLTKDALNLLVDCGSLDAGLAIEDRQQVLLLNTHDHREALRAFTERRPPEYHNV